MTHDAQVEKIGPRKFGDDLGGVPRCRPQAPRRILGAPKSHSSEEEPHMTMIEAAPSLRLRGAAVRPGDAQWDTARQAFNLTVDQQPAAVAFPADAADVAAAIRYAREAGLRVAPQRTGHNAAPLGSLADTLLLRTDALHGVELDAERRTAR